MTAINKIQIAFYPLPNGDTALVMRTTDSPPGQWYVIQPQLYAVTDDPDIIAEFVHLRPVSESLTEEEQNSLIERFRAELGMGEEQ